MTREPVLEIDDIRVTFDTPDGAVEAVRGVSMRVGQGETVAVVGESGSGKSQVMMSAMGLLASNGQATGSVRYRGQEILNLPTDKLNKIRGAKITMIFQEPMTSLDPLYTIEDQLCEPLMIHGGKSRGKASARVLELLKLVQIPEPERKMKAYPYELSGGQRQRVMIAMALANDPDLLIADEPTTALDVTIQAEILHLLADLQKRLGMSILFITHDLGIVEAFADRVYVMRHGKLEEEGETAQIFNAPVTEYTRMLLDAEPSGTKAAPAQDAQVMLEGHGVKVTFGQPAGFLRKDTQFTAVRGIDVALRQEQTIGIVGESGSGKSTLGRALLQLLPAEGRVVYLGHEIGGLDRKGMRPYRDGLQMVFQDPYGSLSPRMTVSEIITEGLLVHEPGLSSKERAKRAAQALEDVGLEPSMRNRFPHEFSGGQRQRIAIARAVVLRPKVIVLDEPTSALDRSVQKQVIELLRRLQKEHALSYLFISHDLAVVRALSDYVMVMKDGAVVEEGQTEQVFDNPRASYTHELMRAAFDLRGILREKLA
ncbi:oligopeptide transport system ATP-binding protein [Cribrihabitans marinus]|uniref:Oligopeptide transport system ATP-binding protein n=1 Tax=Cribrihabitans marinus TaxID=1227549 RepID=A0A1H7CZK4_9RHOB|nr:ABC transporter ATP-binding protein [Cribrihabitans marinus]SEJ95123.1 oligopeptide transport system ATP-binding protein [Cribrihabitans marinus]